MADLITAAAMVYDSAHDPFRKQVEMGMWFAAKQHISTPLSGPARDLITRVLRNDRYPIETAIRTVANDITMQDKYRAAQNKLSDTDLLNFLTAQWTTMAGM